MAYRNYYNKPKGPVVKAERFTPPGGWNPEFARVYDFVVNGTGHGAIEAVAGGGKTTAVVESIIRYVEANPGHRVLFVAFNVSVKDEGQKRLAGYPCDVLTCHGLGFRSMRKPVAWGGQSGRAQFDVQDGYGPYMQSLAEAEIGPEKEKKGDRDALMDLISKAKTCLVDTVPGMVELIERFTIESGYTKAELAERALRVMEFTRKQPGTCVAPKRRGRGNQRPPQSKAAVTFDDEVWAPVVNNWPVDQYDAVFVDEAQDLSPARRALISKALKPGARLFVVGDRYQAIYGFAGADIDSLPTMIDEFGCKLLPLSCSWRCAKSIVAEAQQFNPSITHAASAEDGTVDDCDAKELLGRLEYGDVLLSRTNAPLIRVFFQLARQQIRVKFIGRDYGRMLAYRIKGWMWSHEAKVAKGNASGEFTGETMLAYNDEWLQAQSENRDSGSASDRHRDEHATVIALCAELNSRLDTTASVKEILDRCFAFSPEEKKNAKGADDYITLSSTHRFKGLERDHAYVLVDTYKPGEDQEETNLLYVAVTRAKQHLTYVKGKPEPSSSES